VEPWRRPKADPRGALSERVLDAALITGCSTGIGRATARRLVRSGRPVYATARRPQAIADLAGAGCRTLALDVTDEASMRAAVEAVEKEEGAVGALVNNAGYGSDGPVEEVPIEEVRRQFETNVFGLARLCQLVLPAMRRRGRGRIVNVSSMGGRLTLPGGGFYHATKYAVEALSDALRFEVRGFGVDVVVVEPGTIQTGFGDTAIERIDACAPPESPYTRFREALKEQIRGAYEGPLARLAGSPDDVARVIERALSARRPRPRYPVTAGARVLIGLRRLLGDRGFDLLLRTQFPTPGRG
jgi:NAD(P)-dependent dehydrogenase (short-subunit alcohol dehydrogenase family)